MLVKLASRWATGASYPGFNFYLQGILDLVWVFLAFNALGLGNYNTKPGHSPTTRPPRHVENVTSDLCVCCSELPLICTSQSHMVCGSISFSKLTCCIFLTWWHIKLDLDLSLKKLWNLRVNKLVKFGTQFFHWLSWPTFIFKITSQSWNRLQPRGLLQFPEFCGRIT